MRLFLPFVALLVASCTRSNYTTFSGFAQGTTWSVVVRDAPRGLAADIDSVFAIVDSTFSVFNPRSLTSRINRNEIVSVTPLFERCFALAKEVHRATDGYFDPTVAPLVDAWGFGPGVARSVPRVDSLMCYVGMDKIRIVDGRVVKDDPRVGLDFSSIAKGFTVDLIAAMFESRGVSDYMVEVGGEVRARGLSSRGRPWRVGIDRPDSVFSHDHQAVIGLGVFPDASSVATSGNYRNWFVDEFGRTRVHTIDPTSGEPARGEILSVSIVARDCAFADAWATGVMACGSLDRARALLAAVPVDYYIVHDFAPDSRPVTPLDVASVPLPALASPGFPLSE